MSDLNENSKVFCPKCGWGNATDARFCMNCGEGLARTQENTQNPPLYTTPELSQDMTPNVSQDITPNVSSIETEEVASTPWMDSTSNPYYSTATTTNTGYNPSSSYYVPDTPNEEKKTSGLSIASLVCGIVSLVCCFLTGPLSIAAIVLGIIALVKKSAGKGMAIGGIITSAVAIIFYLILAIIMYISSDSGYYYY